MSNKFKVNNNFSTHDPRRVLNADQKIGEVYRLGEHQNYYIRELEEHAVFFVPTRETAVGFYGKLIYRTAEGTYKISCHIYYCARWEVALKLFSKLDIKDKSVILALANAYTSRSRI